MELWVWASIAAAFFQTGRFMLQKKLSMGALSTGGATFARFAYAAPLTVLAVAIYLLARGAPFPAIGTDFLPFGIVGALCQIGATAAVVALFRERNFAVGITFKKTEVILTAFAGWLVLGESLSLQGWVAIGVGLAGVLLLSQAPAGGTLKAGLTSRATGLGLLSGLLFAGSAVGYRGASLAVETGDPLLRAGLTLAAVVTFQAVVMALWLKWREPGQVAATWGARNSAVWIGVFSMAGSLGWFTAFTLQTAAYVQAVGQVELIFSLMAATLFFHEKTTRRELAGMALLAVSILLLIFLR